MVLDHFRTAFSVQNLDFAKPDGSKRVPEAVAAYRAVAQVSRSPLVLALVHQNLGALYLAAGQVSGLSVWE